MSVLTNERYVEEARRIVELSGKRQILMRTMGACAIRIRCPKNHDILEKMNRNITDLDFVSYHEYELRMRPFMQDLGYTPKTFEGTLETASRRQIYNNESQGIHVDIFFDKLDMCHEIDFRRRLAIDPLTISAADLLLEKTQIIGMNEKDINDLVVLILENYVDTIDENAINGAYISQLTSEDWGLYYTVTTNLREIEGKLPVSYERILSTEEIANVRAKIEKLIGMIEGKPKSMKWKMRARIGTKVKWYKEVEEVTIESILDRVSTRK